MMAAGDAHPESFCLQEMADFIEAQIRVRLAAEQFGDDLLDAHAPYFPPGP